MLVAAGTTGRLTAVGDAFEMEMDRDALGDLPLGRYRTRNVVTRLEPDRRLEWAVGSPDGRLLGHVYGYELDPVSEDGHTSDVLLRLERGGAGVALAHAVAGGPGRPPRAQPGQPGGLGHRPAAVGADSTVESIHPP